MFQSRGNARLWRAFVLLYNEGNSSPNCHNLTIQDKHARKIGPRKGEKMQSKIMLIFRSILLILLALILLLGVAGFILSRQSFPQIEGTIVLPELNAPVEVIRDRNGIPHIYASNEHDLFFVQGYVHAQDRFFQMDVWRHTGSGRLSEMFGKSQIETDKFLRTMGWARIAAKELELAEPGTLSALEDYAEGVNAYLADHHGAKLSFEYVILSLLAPDYSPEPWEPLHTATWGKVLAFQLSGNLSAWRDLKRAQLDALLGEDRAKELIPDYKDTHPIIVAQGFSKERDTGLSLAQRALDAIQDNALEFAEIYGDEIVGSNNWVISGDRTASGDPILANDPHLGIQLPSIWYEVGLHCQRISGMCRFNVVGFSFAGVPGVIIGHNDAIAWGVTNAGPDVLDLYIEKINPENKDQYEVKGEWIDMLIVEEEILVAGGEIVPISIRSTRHGPLFSDVDERFDDMRSSTNLDLPAEYGVSVQWTALEPSNVFESILKINLASNWDEFRSALQLWSVPSQNFVYADKAGNIGYQLPGQIPIRAGGDGTIPYPGWTNEHEWIGFIPFADLPSALNPSKGFIVTANNAIVGSDYAFSLSKVWDAGYRAQRLEQLIADRSQVSVKDIQAMSGDNYNAMGPLLVPLLTNLSFQDSKLNEIIQSLNGWNYQNDMDSAPATVFNAFWRQLLVATFADELPENIPGSSRAFAIIENLIQDPNSDWWDNVLTPEVENLESILRTAFTAAIDEIEDLLGRDADDWTWGELHVRTFKNPLGIGPLGLIFNRGPFPSSGGSSIVNATGWNESLDYQVRSLPSMRMVVDFSNFDNSVTMHTTGQSGHTFHPHYMDMAQAWGNIEFHTMFWTKSLLQAASEGTLTLLPD